MCTCTTGIKVKLFGKYEKMYICMSFTFAILKNIHTVYFFSPCYYRKHPANDDGRAQPIKVLNVIKLYRPVLRHHKAPPPDNICSPDARSGRQETRIRIYILLI